MTGKELILYILQNNLEDVVVLDGCVFIGFMTEEETAVKFGVGIETVRAWYQCRMAEATKIGDSLYFRKDMADPRKTNQNRNEV
jgi:hypothetical protein